MVELKNLTTSSRVFEVGEEMASRGDISRMEGRYMVLKIWQNPRNMIIYFREKTHVYVKQ